MEKKIYETPVIETIAFVFSPVMIDVYNSGTASDDDADDHAPEFDGMIIEDEE